MVEAAIVFPILLLLVASLLEYGWMFRQSEKITNAARHAARLAILPDADTAVITTVITDMLADSGITPITVNYDSADSNPGTPLQVTVSVSYADIGLGMPLVLVPDNLEATVTMAIEGPNATPP